jgi:hypothetical protein
MSSADGQRAKIAVWKLELEQFGADNEGSIATQAKIASA